MSVAGVSTLIVLQINKMMNKNLRAIREPPMPLFSKCPGNARYDGIYWNEAKFYLVAFIFGPANHIFYTLRSSQNY